MSPNPAAPPGSWLRAYRTAPHARCRLVCLPHAGGAATFFKPWAERLPAGIDLFAVRYPGRQDRMAEPFAERMADLADGITADLLPLLDRPLALFGHSMGASVAYEVGVRLESRHGFVPRRLFVSGRQAPHIATTEDYEGYDDEELVEAVRALGDADGGALDLPGIRELVLPALRADFRLLRGYRPADPAKVAAPITAYAGLSDPGCPVPGARAWSELTLGGFALRVFPGDHFYLVPEQAALVADVGSRLAGESL